MAAYAKSAQDFVNVTRHKERETDLVVASEVIMKAV